MSELTAPVVTCARHRMQTDGPGITTLVCFHGCPLRCKWCINSFAYDPKTAFAQVTARELYEKIRPDALYFLATGGGVTFGGGEPLLYARFLEEFAKICGSQWNLCAETSLWVPWENVETASRFIETFFVDCKDVNPEIYRSYTGKDNALMLSNLSGLLKLVGPERIVARLPLIPEFNTHEDRLKSREQLEKMGIRQFDLFEYRQGCNIN